MSIPSSASRTRTPARASGGSRSAVDTAAAGATASVSPSTRSAAATGPTGTATVNVLPTSAVVRTSMSPPSIRANCRLIVSPRPVPPNLRVVLTSAWTNGWNSLARSASVMPTPVSWTSNRTTAAVSDGPSQETRRVIPPLGVNLTAFPIRLIRICAAAAGRSGPTGAPAW